MELAPVSKILTVLRDRIANKALFVLGDVKDALGSATCGVAERITVAAIERSLKGTVVPSVVKVCR